MRGVYLMLYCFHCYKTATLNGCVIYCMALGPNVIGFAEVINTISNRGRNQKEFLMKCVQPVPS